MIRNCRSERRSEKNALWFLNDDWPDNLFNDKLLHAWCVIWRYNNWFASLKINWDNQWLSISSRSIIIYVSFSFIYPYRTQCVNGCKFSMKSRHTHRVIFVFFFFHFHSHRIVQLCVIFIFRFQIGGKVHRRSRTVHTAR